MSEKDGGPAFPQIAMHGGAVVSGRGMSLRDYFAGQALTGMCANTKALQKTAQRFLGDPNPTAELVAAGAYEIADAMLKAREPE